MAEAHRLRDYLKLFRDDAEDSSAVASGQARAILEWAAMPYHEVFTDWLRRNADAPVPVDAAIVANTVRANTFKEILNHLRHEMKSAKSLLGE